MQTLKLLANKKEDIKKASELIKKGEVVGIPTETVYGLGANALDSSAVLKIFKAKGRPQDNPLIIHIADLEMLSKLVLDVNDKTKKLISAFWPGALTIIFKKTDIIPKEISCGLDTVAIRFPNHSVALDIIKTSGVPVAAPSANTSGRPSPTTAKHVFEDLDGKISAIVEDSACDFGVESTVIDMTREIPILLRPGGVTKEEIEKIIGKILVDDAVYSKISDTKKVSSPGMKYRHYAPKAEVIVVCGDAFKTALYIEKNKTKNDGVLCFDEFFEKFENAKSFGSVNDISEQGRQIFAKLREFDETNVQRIFSQCPVDENFGLAVSNRLKKSAGFNVINIEDKIWFLD